jgi:hypothetical protein
MITMQSAKRIQKLRDEGKKKRATMLALMPDEFTSAELADKARLDGAAARAQVQKMLKWGEVKTTSAYKIPRVYRKVIKHE